MKTGTARGISTVKVRRNGPNPTASAASITLAGTESSAVGTAITSSAVEYTVSAMITFIGSMVEIPASGGMITNNANDGTV